MIISSVKKFYVMLSPSTLKIYNASAGSGKTFFLVKNYLYILFKSSNNDEFKHILSLTFTNKASEEMKRRILQCIKEFSNQKVSEEYYSLFSHLVKDLNLTKQKLYKRSKKILSAIFHDFSSFSISISTIDKFTYRTILSFLSKKIDLEMDTNSFLLKVVENLFSKLKKSEKWSNIFVQCSLEKLKEGKNWDIRKELLKIAFLIVEENSFLSMNKMKTYSFYDFLRLKKTLLNRTKKFEKKCKKQGEKFFEFLEKTSIQEHSFIHSDLPRLFKKLSLGDLFINPFKKRLEKSIHMEIFHSKWIETDQKTLISKNKKKIIFLYKKTKHIYKKYISSYILEKLFLKHLSFLSIIHEIEKEFVSLKEEKKIILNAELNKILHEEITTKEPFPHIYEKMGIQYKHYFIDEFQDISFLQWSNIRILIENALSENGSAMIVGDPKQSIYRWRGGDPKQFIHLISYPSQFYQKQVFTIDTNFRSYKEIVKFNNSLYQSVSKFFHSPIYQKLYKDSQQKIFKKTGGYVELNFIYNIEKNNYKQYVYLEIRKRIKKLLIQNKYKLSDIAILVRSNEEGNFLSEKLIQDGFLVNTSVSLLIKNHLEIEIIIHFFYIFLKPHCYQKRASLILLLLQNKLISTNKKEDHDFLMETLFLPLDLFLKKVFFNKKSFNFNKLYNNKSLYEIAEKIIHSLGFFKKKNQSYNTSSIYSFLDFIHRAIKSIGNNSIVDFLEYWELKKKKESISVSENIDAIHVMTIHQSKGLQFPIVLLPFVDWNVCSKKKEKEGAWINVSPHLYHGLNTIYLEIESYLQYIDDDNYIKKFYEDYLSNIRFDNLNLLYVATTRPVEKLFLFTKYEKDQSVSSYIKNFLRDKRLWNDQKFQYSFGKE
ncbi:UvrD-helicase domain-containing protein [Blattabacterium cuenoti]|uniref:UvrD-helicase domain-containing protein n=1 Tax=Blattabacterium cuenoti TaxID=1653831 RepID=UPI00293BCAD1|nr:UvrD-helicase domain-containing protein [Blattabacterium cuenoti]